MTRMGFILLCTIATAATAQPAAQLSTDKARDSYALGQQTADSIKLLNADLDINALLQGIRDNLEGKPSLLSGPELTKARDRARTSMLQNLQKKRQEEGAKYGKAGQAFLAAHSKEKGVVTTPSGLQYVIQSASPPGPRPGPKSRVLFEYKASIAGGAEFDSSAALGKPALMGVSDGIKGLAEAFQLMTIGSKYRFVIPPQLAYGAEGFPSKVPPNATLIYEITLREVVR
ncbi:FKBP-type peptidyl-prolyl cis-trans isomerase N-terminal domain-containing protein [Archangium lansingense]|uniref:FKBP-type peptidyl-prolyl cis-trans isomerase N-terminal domain-containing protein n=1 Tax=Archangium lansingense TaxID=2995310 RepID=UPI003B7C4D81